MVTVACPSCTHPLGVDDNNPSIEWECPTCEAAFLVQKDQNSNLNLTIVDPGKNSPATGASASSSTDDACVYALERLLKGDKPRKVRELLTASGHTTKQAEKIVQTALRFKQDQESQQQLMRESGGNTGTRNMVIGGIVCAVGLVVTLGTMSAARDSGGGQIIIAWGAIVFGGIQFLRGCVQSKQS